MKKFILYFSVFLFLFFSSSFTVFAATSNNLTCPDPNSDYSVSSENYFVWFDKIDNKYYAWFLSSVSKIQYKYNNILNGWDFYDAYGRCYELDQTFSKYTLKKNGWDNLEEHYNSNVNNIYLVYSTHARYNSTDNSLFLTEGYQSGVTPDSDNNNNEETNGLLSSIINSIKDIINNIKNLGTTISNSFINLSQNIVVGIADFVKSLFIPNESYLVTKKEQLEKSFSSLMGFNVSSVQTLFDSVNVSESMLVDEEFTINLHGVGNVKFKAFDNYFLLQGINKFKPILRGFITLMLIFFNMNQLLNVIGQGSISSVLNLSVKNNNGTMGKSN